MRMALETAPQEPANNGEERKIRAHIQAGLMNEIGYNDKPGSKPARDWDALRFADAYEKATLEHPDLPEIYKKNTKEALKIMREMFENTDRAA